MRPMPEPSVSVIIPTCNRPAMVVRAVDTALQQSHPSLEVIVVIDGDATETLAALEAVSSPRLRLLPLHQKVGGARARNEGVAAARGTWVAFLDDDDEWFPAKIEKQLATARCSPAAYPVVACKVVARTPSGEFVWPRKLPREPISEYLLARGSWSQGEGLLQTSTLLAPRELLLQHGFENELRKHQDWDWLLRAVKLPGVRIEFVDEPLAVWNLDSSHASVSRSHDWEGSLAWIRDRRELVTPRAYAGFVATQVASQAARQREWRAFLPILAEMFEKGQPKTIDVLLLLGMWFVPGSLRERLRSA
jgi:glycosyltransferase involved in cell wall biosynthesis